MDGMMGAEDDGLTPEEREQIAVVTAEQEGRMRSLLEKQDEEMRKKKEKTQMAKEEMQKWDDKRKKELASRRKLNEEDEWSFNQRREELKSSANQWEKVIQHVEIKSQAYPGQAEVSRMRAAMLARKGDIARGTSGKQDTLI